MNRFNSVLIANRGEIACRVIRSTQSMGYRAIAVYSDADAKAPHVMMADDAIHIGASPVQESYLVAENILKAAQQSGAGAIHPGYGFLSENAEFADACTEAGLVFIGPSANAIRVMGNKAEAKRRMLQADVPCVPGYEGENQDDSVLIAEAEKIGAPIMVKAAAGGGGRGMRLVEDLKDLGNAIKLARSESQNAFGSGELILEKAIIEPRHVEVQVFADRAGNTVHLGERDCSVQRRHQKVIEEAPCPIMTEDLRERMGAAAVAAAKSIDYEGAGTVEFLLDQQGDFYFLEMNTRLQVEHPVTECITGLDLVELQLQVAQGDDLGLHQQDISLTGHAIEVRLYSEDPAMDFLPTSGLVELWRPASGEGVRIDSGISSGQEVSPFYDPMVAKVIASGPTREVARLRLVNALKQTMLYGVKNNKAFLVDCLCNQQFIEGQATTAFIAQEFVEANLADFVPDVGQAAIAAVVDTALSYQRSQAKSIDVSTALRNWSSAGRLMSHRKYVFGDLEYALTVNPCTESSYAVTCRDAEMNIEIVQMSGDRARLSVDGKRCDIQFAEASAGDITLSFEQHSARFLDQLLLAGVVEDAAGGGQTLAPMHGLVLDVRVQEGQDVTKNQTLLVLEAMKMQHEITAAVDGRVLLVSVQAGDQVAADDLLVEIETSEE